MGLETAAVATYQNLIEAIDTLRPALVLLDNRPGRTSEVGTLATLRKRTATWEPLYVQIVDREWKGTSHEAKDERADEHLRVPIIPAELTTRVDTLLRLYRHRQQVKAMETTRQRERGLLARYFSDDIVEQVLSTDTAIQFGGTNLDVSVLFFDMRNSTGIAERLEPTVFSEFLSEVLTDVTDLVYGNRGSVNKFTGDGIFATFGAPVSTDDDAYNCVRCGVQIQDYLATFNDVRPDYLAEPLRAGVGISTGRVFAGNIGSVRRMEYTILGDAVNIASRLETMTKTAGASILIDGRTVDRLGDRIDVRKLDLGQIRGRNESIDIYQLLSVQET